MDDDANRLPEVLSAPRIHDGGAIVVVGLKHRYEASNSAQMPSQWKAFQQHIGNIDNQKGNVAYGVLCNGDNAGRIDYITGVEVSRHSDTPQELVALHIAPQHYAVFQHDGHVAEIGGTWKAIFEVWVPQSGYELEGAPQLERYGENFNVKAGTGDIEIWIPVRK